MRETAGWIHDFHWDQLHMVSIQRDLGVSAIDVVPKARLGVRAILKTRRPCGLQPCAARANGP